MKLIKMIYNDIQSIHESNFIFCAHIVLVVVMVHKANSTIVQNDVIVRQFINSMNMEMDAQYVYAIMQLMVGNVIIMYEYAIKEDHNKFAKEVNHG